MMIRAVTIMKSAPKIYEGSNADEATARTRLNNAVLTRLRIGSGSKCENCQANECAPPARGEKRRRSFQAQLLRRYKRALNLQSALPTGTRLRKKVNIDTSTAPASPTSSVMPAKKPKTLYTASLDRVRKSSARCRRNLIDSQRMVERPPCTHLGVLQTGL